MSAISDALESCSRDEPWWTNPLVRALDDRHHGLAFVWVSRCVRKLLLLSESSKREQLISDLDRLDAMSVDPPAPEEIVNIGSQIWYRPDRDEAQTAVAKLYEAFAAQLNAKDRRYTTAMGAPIRNLVFGFAGPSWNDRAIALRTIVIDEFRAIASEQNVDAEQSHPLEPAAGLVSNGESLPPAQ